MSAIGQEFHSRPAVALADLKAVGIPTESLIRAGSIRQARARFAFELRLGRYFEYAVYGLPSWCIAITEDNRVIDVVAWPIEKPLRFASLTRRICASRSKSFQLSIWGW